MSYLEDRLKRKQGIAPKLEFKKPKKPIKRLSDKRQAEMVEGRKSVDKKEDDYFEYWMEHAEPVCEECGMRCDWLKKPEYATIWRACQAHALPKKKRYGFPSLRNNLDNHFVLFPSWGGHYCGHHGFYDSSWFNASTMDIWPKAVEIFKRLYHFIPKEELKNIPEILLKEIEK